MAKQKYKSYDPTPEQLRKQALYEDLRNKLYEAEKIAEELSDYVIVRDWIDDLCCADRLEGYGYTVELREENEDLKERLDAYPDKPPKIDNMVDAAKYEFFIENFSKIPSESLKWVVKTVNENKITV